MEAEATTGVAGSDQCWVCGSRNTHMFRIGETAEHLTSEDLRITDSRYGRTLSLRRCQECGFRFADSAETEKLTSLYEELTDPDYEGSQRGRLLQMRRLISLVRLAKADARTALDVGAASGLLVAEARRAGLDAIGIEPSRSLVEVARRENGVELLCGVLPHPELQERRFDVVFLVDVVEHVAEPIALLQGCIDLLGDDGLLLVVTPSMSGIAGRLFGSRCWHYRLAHVGYFSRRSLEVAFARVGLRVHRWLRVVSFFEVKYLARRLESYLPVAWLNRLAFHVPPVRWLYGRVIPFTIFDSHAVLARRAGEDLRSG